MTQAQLYAFVSSLLFNYAMDVTLFNTWLDEAQAAIENLRPWMWLRVEDASQSAGPGTSFTTAIKIAATNNDFRKWYGDNPIILTDSQNNPLGFTEIPIGMKFHYRNVNNRYFCDYPNGNLFLCGQLTQSYTVHQFYIRKAPLVSFTADGTTYPNTWVFPTEFHKLLAYFIAVRWKGVDYDLINNQNVAVLGQAIGPGNAASLLGLLDNMTRWDSDLQAQGQTGFDPFGDDGGGWQGNSGGGRMAL